MKKIVETNGMNKVVCFSGGLDSTILLHCLVKQYNRDNVLPISFNYGQRHSVELDMAQKTVQKLGVKHQIIDISFLGEVVKDVTVLSASSNKDMITIEDAVGDPAPLTEVPYRNQIFLSLACAYARSNNADSVYIANQRVDEYGYWDTSLEFIDRFNHLISLARKNKVKIESPFVDFDKCDEIKFGLENGITIKDLEFAWSCYTGDGEKGACGTCPTCSERLMNFSKAGISDPVKYQIEINWKKLIEENRS